MSDDPSESEKPKFNPEAWQKAYDETPDLPVDFTDPEQTEKFLQKAMDEAGGTGKLMRADEYQDFWKQKERNLENLMAAEMGDDTVVKMVAESGREEFLDIAKNKHSWEVYKNIVKGYKIKGDHASIYMLMQVFPDEQSQLRAELEEELEETEVNPRYQGYDTTFGRLKDVARGNQFDMLPGTVDFRDFVSGDRLDVKRIAGALFDEISYKKDVYSEDWDKFNQTLDNIEKKFGEDTAHEVSNKFTARYRDYKENNVGEGNGS